MVPEYETVIGLEVHVELKTNSKIFCNSSTAFGGEPNTHVCPVCLGLPGVLPIVNKKALEYTIRTALALNCEIAGFSKFDRKNYYYPDMPKNYQISQYDLPFAQKGHLNIELNGNVRRIRITRVHLEEDTGKLVHPATITTSPYSLVDYNRAGVPLMEIVSEPDLRSPEEARTYLEKLRTIILYVGVSDCKMEEGSLRCDANVSVRVQGKEEYGTKTEIKNMNSFKSLQRALAYEVERQIEVLGNKKRVIQETRAWDEGRGITLSMRSKEEAHDYRYFPEPDLVPLVISSQWVEEIRASLPELPEARETRYRRDYGLPAHDAARLAAEIELAEFFEACVKSYPQPKMVSNWINGELSRLLNLHNINIAACPLTPQQLGALLKLIEKGTISGKIAKTVFEEMFNKGKDPAQIIQEKGLIQISDEDALVKIVDEIMAQNQKVAADYRAGKDRALAFLVGQVMKATRGKANPELVNRLLKEKMQ